MRAVLTAMALALCLVLVCLPRFDRRDLYGLSQVTSKGRGEANPLGDAAQYMRYVALLRGVPVVPPKAPFIYRPLVPCLAAPLPVAPMTALNLVNVTALLVALAALSRLLLRMGCSYRRRLLGCLLFIVSFPTFYYGAIGYVDPAAVALVMLGVGCILAEQWSPLLLVLVLGALTKETTILLLPVAWVALIAQRVPLLRQAGWLSAWGAAFLVPTLLVRHMFSGEVVVWEPSWALLLANLARPRSLISFVLTLGLPGLLALALLTQARRRARPGVRLPLIVLTAGFALSFAVAGYALTAAYADGRFIWLSYPFSIPLALLLLPPVRWLGEQTTGPGSAL